MKQRVLAIVGAVALVVLAVVVRSQLADDGGSGGPGRRGGGTPAVACTPDLQAICDALVEAGAIQADTPTLDLDEAADPPADLDGWITWDPSPGIAGVEAELTGLEEPWQVGRLLGSAALAVGTRTNTKVTYPQGCAPSAFTWSCLATAGSDGVAVGVGTGRTAESLARLYPVAQTLLPDADSGFNDISGNDLRSILSSPVNGQADFPQQLTDLQTKPGALSLLVGPIGALELAPKVNVLATTPEATVAIVLAPRSDASEDLLSRAFDDDELDEALRGAGVEPGTGKLAPRDRAGDLYAIREKVG